MKRIKLEVVVNDEDARETLTFFQNLVVRNICEYSLIMEGYDG